MPDDRDATRLPHFSARGFATGVWLSAPIMPGMAAFGLAFGAVAAQKGLSVLEATLMTALVFAGASQFVAVEIWTRPMTETVIVTLALVTAAVNVRFVLMTASLRPWLQDLPSLRIYPALLLLTDPAWLMVARYRAEGGSDASILYGSGLVLWLIWIVGTTLGAALGSQIAEPGRFGIDLVFPCFFAVMLVPLWKGTQRAMAWIVASVTALLVAKLVPGWWFVIAGALAGSAVVAAVNDSR